MITRSSNRMSSLESGNPGYCSLTYLGQPHMGEVHCDVSKKHDRGVGKVSELSFVHMEKMGIHNDGAKKMRTKKVPMKSVN